MSSSEYVSPLKKYTKQTIVEDLTPTGGCNIMSSGGKSAEDYSYYHGGHLMSDVSSKVVNINSVGGANLNNPFNHTPQQQQIQFLSQLQSAAEGSQNTAKLEDNSAFNQSDEQEHYEQTSNQNHVDNSYGENDEYDQNNVYDHQLEYSASASALNKKGSTVNKDIQGHAYNKSITPFELLTKDYLSKKSDVVNKYSNLNSDNDDDDDEQEEVSFLDPTHRTETPSEREQHQSNNQQDDNLLDKAVEQADVIGLSERQFPSYRTAKEEQTDRSEHNPLLTEEDKIKQITNDKQQDNNIYNDTQSLFTFKPQQQQPQQQEQVDQQLQQQLQKQEQQEQQQQEVISSKTEQRQQDLLSRNLKSRQEDKFLTLDDFIQRKSLAKIKEQNKLLETPKDEDKTLESQKERLQEDKSPRIIDKNQLIQREKDQEIKKKKQIELLKIKAIEKEKLRNKRQNSAIVIQKWARGFLQRVQFARMQKNFRYMRKLRRILSIAYGKIKFKRIRLLISVLKESGNYVKNEKDDLMQKYMDHCATSVQKLWRGYYARRYLIDGKIAQNKRQRLLITIVKGWKIRKILSGCKEILAIKRSLFEIQNSLRQTENRNKQKLSSLMQERKRKIEELCKIVPVLYRNGRWIYSYQKRQKMNSNKNIAKNSSNNTNSFINLKQSQIQQQQQSNNQHHYVSQMSQQVLKNNYGNNNAEKMVEFPLQKLPSQTFKSSDINIDSNNQRYNQNNYNQRQNQQYPSYQQQQQQPYNDYSNYEEKQNTYDRTPQYNKSPDQNEYNDVLWPSKQQNGSPSEDDSQIMWASSAINSLKQSQKQGFQKQIPQNNRFQQKKASFENTSEQYENIEAQTQRTAVGEKLEILDKQMKPQYTKRQNACEDEFNESQYFTQSKFQSSQKLDYAEEKSSEKSNRQKQFDDMPIRPAKQNYDDVPIKQNKKDSLIDDQNNSLLKYNPIEERPIKSMLNNSQYQTHDDSMIQQKPQYNFEDMIEQALCQQNDTVQQKQNNKKVAPKRAKTTRNKSREGNDSNSDYDNDDDSQNLGQSKSVKQAKKQNLKKRQKYDPRKAIEEAKKTQEQQQLKSKSAFPEGMLTKNNRTRSATGLPRINDEELKEEVESENAIVKLSKPNKKRVTQQHQQQQLEDEYKHDGLDDENGHQTSTNASSTQGGSKAFLKRKSKQVLNFQKCNWNVKSRVSCWTNNKTERSNNLSQTRKSTSQIRSPRIELIKAQAEPNLNNNPSSFSKVANKRGIPPPTQVNYNSTNPSTATINLEQLQQQHNQKQQQTIKNQKSVPQLKPQAIQQLQQQQQYQQQQQLQLKQQPISSFQQNIKQIQRQDDGFDAESIPDEAYQQIEQIAHNHIMKDKYDQSQLKNQPNNSQNSLMNTQLTLSNLGQFDDYVASQNPQGVELQQDNVTLQLEELEKIIELFHPKPQSFTDSEIKENRRQTCIPHLSLNSMFFTCYSDDIYDTILEDLREHYISLCNE